jgi:hypothetical protein
LKNALSKKVNCLGNYSISLFWEEKIMLMLRTLQIFGLLYVAFIEQWPRIDGEEGMYLFGASFVYFISGRYYTLITTFIPFAINLAVWVGVFLLTLFLAVCCFCLVKCS